MEQLNKRFIKGDILKAEELNEIVAKINELANGALICPSNPEPYSSTDYQNMLVPAWHKVLKKWIFLPYSPVSPEEPNISFPYTFPFNLK